MALYRASFPPDERMEELEMIRTLHDAPRCQDVHLPYPELWASFTEDQQCEGFFWMEIAPNQGLGFLIYIAVNPLQRRQGLGSKLLQAARERSRGIFEGHDYRGMVLEVERPEDATDSDDQQIRDRRMSFFTRFGIELISADYVQPSLGQGKRPVQLNLMGFDLTLDSDRRETVRGFYQAFFGLPPTHPYVKATLRGTR